VTPRAYLLNRIRLMDPGEVLRRVGETALDHARFAVRRRRRRRLRAQRFVAPLAPSPRAVLDALWQAQPWHGEALAHLLAGELEADGRRFRVEGDNPWVRCPDRRRELPMIMGRRYLFARMYAEANMQYLGTLNRHYHLVHLAKAAHLGRTEPRRVLDAMHDWVRANPYLEGVNWSDCLNHAVRVVNWCLAFQYLGLERIDAGLAASLHEQGLFIEQHLSFGSSAANHLLGELWGLYFLGHCLPDLPRARRWRRASVEGLEREIERQLSDEGLHLERSVSYHRYLLEYLLLVLESAPRLGARFAPRTRATLHAAAEVLAELLGPDGSPPLLGDCGHEINTDIHYVSFRHTDPYASVLGLAAAVLGDRSLLPAGIEHDPRLPWTVDLSRLDPDPGAGAAAPRAVRRSTALPQAGLFILRDGAPRRRESMLVARCGEMGFGPLAAHAHADMLHFVLWVRGVAMLVDPGTFAYHPPDPRWRHYFRGTAAHNTLSLDGADQAASGGPMIWRRHVTGILEAWQPRRNGGLLAGRHAGYAPALHRRRFELDGARGRLHVADRIEGGDGCEVRSHLHFHPRVQVALPAPGRIEARRAGVVLRIGFDPALHREALRGDEQRPAGWFSPLFGIREPAWTVCLVRTPHAAACLDLTFEWEPGAASG